MRDFSYTMQQMSDFSCKNQGREPGQQKKKNMRTHNFRLCLAYGSDAAPRTGCCTTDVHSWPFAHACCFAMLPVLPVVFCVCDSVIFTGPSDPGRFGALLLLRCLGALHPTAWSEKMPFGSFWYIKARLRCFLHWVPIRASTEYCWCTEAVLDSRHRLFKCVCFPLQNCIKAQANRTS
jgi:hypothetical protein